MEECGYIKTSTIQNFYKIYLYPNMKMKHKTIIFALLGVLIAIFILVRYGLFIVYWFTTPNALERTEAEKQLTEHLKVVFKTNELTISPEYDLEKDTTYTVYIEDIPCTDTLSSKEKAIYIKNKLDSIALKPRFKRYIIHLGYECNTYNEYEYKRNYRK